jgi:hypothetical protein
MTTQHPTFDEVLAAIQANAFSTEELGLICDTAFDLYAEANPFSWQATAPTHSSPPPAPGEKGICQNPKGEATDRDEG